MFAGEVKLLQGKEVAMSDDHKHEIDLKDRDTVITLQSINSGTRAILTVTQGDKHIEVYIDYPVEIDLLSGAANMVRSDMMDWNS